MWQTRPFVYGLIVAALVAIGGGLYTLHGTINTFLSGTDNITALTFLGHEWRSNARELQRLARAVVLEGASGEHVPYLDLLAVQSGTAPRPLETALAPGKQVSLKELAVRHGATEAELRQLDEADRLLRGLREREAPYLDAARHGNALASPAEAASLFNTDYERDMEAGLARLQDFSTLLTQRGNAFADEKRKELFVLLLLVSLSVLTAIIGMSAMAYTSHVTSTGHQREILRFYLGIVLVLLASIFVPALLSFNTARKDFTAAMEKRQDTVAREILRELRLRFEHARQFAQILATRPPIHVFLQDNTSGVREGERSRKYAQEAHEVLETFTRGYGDTSRVALLDAAGNILMASWTTGLARDGHLLPRKELEQLHPGDALLSSSLVGNRPEAVVAVPVSAGKKPANIGYIAMILDMDGRNAVWNNRLENRERMNVFVLDHTGRIAASSNPAWKPGQDASGTFAGMAAKNRSEGLFRYTTEDGEERLGVYLYVPELQWTVGVTSSERIIFNDVQTLLVSSILLNSFASFSALALITMLLLRLITYLRRGEQRLSVVIQGAEIGLWDLNVRTGLFHHNEFWTILLGQPPLRGEKTLNEFTDACHPDDQASFTAFLHKALAHRGSSSVHHECRLRHTDGNYYWRYATARVVERGKGGDPLRLTGTLMDIQARKMAEMNEEEQRELLEAQIRQRTRELEDSRNAALAATRAKSDFLSMMSHEIRTPMNAIIGFIHLFDRQNLTEKQLSYLEKIKLSAGALLCVINDVLDLSKIEAGKLEVERVPFQLHSVINTVQSIVSFTTRDKGLDLQMDVEEGLPEWVMGAPSRLQQVLLNLMSNAIKFTPQGFVRLSVRKLTPSAGDHHGTGLTPQILFEVSDSGIGVAPEHMSKLFTPFTQADSSVSRKYGGTGLGLAICRQLTELMGGSIKAHSRVGEGASFQVRLPLESAPPQDIPQAGPALASRSPMGSALVLVVDDNLINQEIAKALLEAEGLMVDVVDNGEQAISQVCKQRYDLVFMDLQMPVMDGLEATRRIRNLGRDDAAALGHLSTLPIIAMTANALQDDKERCLKAGMDAHLGKPIDPEALHHLLHHWLSPQDC